MKIIDEKGNAITATPDFSTGRYLEDENGNLVFTKYTTEELAEIKEKEEKEPITALQVALAEVYELIGGTK